MAQQTHLPPRVIELLTLLAAGYSRPEAARMMVITEKTVKSHLDRARLMLEAKNTMHAVTIAISHNIIPFPRDGA